MRISFNWLKEYCSTNLPIGEISKILTDCGLEVESIEKFQSVKGGLEGMVIGEVKTRIQHPNADRLSITTVDLGTGTDVQIVCGASNVAAGQKVVVATVGATLYPTDGESFQISKSKIRGEVSEGMICAEDEIGLGSSHEGIMVLNPSARPGTPAGEYFKIEDDKIFEIGLTPNRADAASHIGVARDLNAALINNIIPKASRFSIPAVDAFKTDNRNYPIEVRIEDSEACPRYAGLTISGISVASSPQWLQNRLLAIGVKPINNIVDITNFVLHECGQPLHAFDADKINGKKIIVKPLPENTPFITLDGEERKLSSEDLMICDEKGGLCMAGVYGGIGSGVSTETKNIFLESACFNPASVRKTSKRHNLKTDAAFRFERGVDPNNLLFALKRAALLIREMAGGQISSDISDHYPKPIEPARISLSYRNLYRLIGNEIDKDKVKRILQSLEIRIDSETDETLSLTVPTFKVDVKREADITEEVLRIYGYNNVVLPGSIRASLNHESKPNPEKVQETVSNYLSGSGFCETMSLSLTKSSYYINLPGFDPANSVSILNPLSSDLDILRQTLLFSGLETLSYNKNRKQADLKLYEFGKTYFKNGDTYREEKHLSLLLTGRKQEEQWNTANDSVDFFYAKAFAENVLRRLGVQAATHKFHLEKSGIPLFAEGLSYRIDKQPVLEIGRLARPVLKSFDLSQEVFYADFNWDKVLALLKSEDTQFKEVPRFPEVRRDLSMLLDKDVPFAEIEKIAFQTERSYLRKVTLFDVYEGEKIAAGKKSYAVSFTLLNEGETLTDKQIDKSMERIVQQLEKNLGAALRK